jgi:hypothetical protein
MLTGHGNVALHRSAGLSVDDAMMKPNTKTTIPPLFAAVPAVLLVFNRLGLDMDRDDGDLATLRLYKFS